MFCSPNALAAIYSGFLKLSQVVGGMTRGSFSAALKILN